jgi:predicted transcriptional regulator
MSESIIEQMTSNLYKVLKILYFNQVKLANGDVIVPLTQQEIADMMSLSLISVNAIFKDLMNNELVFAKGRGKYGLSDKANDIVSNIEKLCEDKGEK